MNARCKITTILLSIGLTFLGKTEARSQCTHTPPDRNFVETMLKDPVAGTTEKRVAFVVGNSRYDEEIGALRNPAADAAAMAERLSSLGFDVYLDIDATQAGTERCLGKVRGALAGAALGLFFYAGHGVQVEDRNYLVAVDAGLGLESQQGLVAVERILAGFQETSKWSLFILDACRTTPWSDVRAGLSVGTTARAIGRGGRLLEEDDSNRSDAGLYLAYATSPNSTASDGSGIHSPFSEALLKYLGTPGYSLDRVMASVKNAVGEATDWSQTPWTRSSLPSPVYLNGRKTLEEVVEASNNLADKARKHSAKGELGSALTAALKGLPSSLTDEDVTTWFRPAHDALYDALRQRPVTLPLKGRQRMEMSADGRYVFTAGLAYNIPGRKITVWDAATARVLATIGRDGQDQYVTDWSVSLDSSKLATTSADGLLEIWETGSWNLLHRWRGHERPQMGLGYVHGDVAFDSSGSYIVSAGDGAIKLWDVGDGSLVRSYHFGEPVKTDTKDLPKFPLMREDGSVKMPSTEEMKTFTEQMMQRVTRETARKMSVVTRRPRISHDGRLIAASTTNRLILWNLATGEVVQELTGPQEWSIFDADSDVPAGYSFDLAGERIAGFSGKSVWVWSTRTGELISDWSFEGFLQEASISPDGRRVAIRTAGGWEYYQADSGRPIAEPAIEETLGRRLVFSPSAELLGELGAPGLLDWKQHPTGNRLIALALSELDEEQRTQVGRGRLQYWPRRWN